MLGAHQLYSEINLCPKPVFSILTMPKFTPLLLAHVLVERVGRGAQQPGHLGTFSTEDCEVMARGGHGLQYR